MIAYFFTCALSMHNIGSETAASHHKPELKWVEEEYAPESEENYWDALLEEPLPPFDWTKEYELVEELQPKLSTETQASSAPTEEQPQSTPQKKPPLYPRGTSKIERVIRDIEACLDGTFKKRNNGRGYNTSLSDRACLEQRIAYLFKTQHRENLPKCSSLKRNKYYVPKNTIRDIQQRKEIIMNMFEQYTNNKTVLDFIETALEKVN